MKKILFMGLLLGILATMAVATTGTMSAAFAGDGHDETKHDTNPGQSKDPTQKNHGCPKGEKGYDSSDENCYHPG